MDGYDSQSIHVFTTEEDSDSDNELPSRVKYSVILQEEHDFIDED